MTDDVAALLDRVRDRVTPTAAERKRLTDVTETLVERAETALAERSVGGEVVLAGSTARDTWLTGDRDVDIFVRLPPALDRAALREHGLAVGHAILPESREEYAEHPYVVGEFEGVRVDVVPCYALETATDIRSAVDRTPFHTRYVRSRLDGRLAGEVRVCKQFLKGIGVYGSDLRTRGFSGYLTELLVLEFDGFRPLVEAAADWQPPVRFDPADHGRVTFDDALVVIDPTDPERNVAAVCSAESLARLQHFVRELLKQPREELFFPSGRDPLEAAAVRETFAERETTPVALEFERPDVVEDQLWPQLERSRTGIEAELDRRGFDVIRSDGFADDQRAVVLFELEVLERPAVERHVGPPVQAREHARRFYSAYEDSEEYGPFLDGDRYVVEREREFRTAPELLEDELFEMALGADVETALESGYDLLVGQEVASLADRFGRALSWYLRPEVRVP